MLDWRELEAERVQSGVPVRRVAWVCEHQRRDGPLFPKRAHTPTPIQKLFVDNAAHWQRDKSGRYVGWVA